MSPEECRAYADACCPRVLEDGWTINAQHVAIEQSLRRMHGHPSYIGDLDGPGRYRPSPSELPGQLMVLELTAPPGRPYPPERVPDVLGQQITVDVTVGGRPFLTPGTVQAAELLDTGNLQLTIRLAGATLPDEPAPATGVRAELLAAADELERTDALTMSNAVPEVFAVVMPLAGKATTAEAAAALRTAAERHP